MKARLKTGDTIRIGSKYYTLEVADNFVTRFFGLMGRKSISHDSAMFITPCNSIHTFFMRFTMTAIFVDKDMRVTKVIPNMRPWKMAFAFSSKAVFELAEDEGINVKEGDIFTDIYHNLSEDNKEKPVTTCPKVIRD